MKSFLASTAVAIVISSTANADGHMAAFSNMEFDDALHLNASELVGMRVYATEDEIDGNLQIATDGEKDWDDIGEINEIVLSRDGKVEAVIIGVGGFIGIGEKDVAVDMSQIKFVKEEGDDDDFFLVINANAAGVEEAETYSHSAGADGEMRDTNRDVDSNPVAMDNGRPMLTAPTVDREGYANAKVDDLTTEDLTGARVYGPGDEDVGEISELLLKDNGELDRAIIDVGGFLGIGERPVAVTMEELQIVRSADGGNVRVYIDSSQDALEQQPEYDG